MTPETPGPWPEPLGEGDPPWELRASGPQPADPRSRPHFYDLCLPPGAI